MIKSKGLTFGSSPSLGREQKANLHEYARSRKRQVASVGLRLARTTHRCTRNQNFPSNAFVSTSKNHACVESLGPFTQILYTYSHIRTDDQSCRILLMESLQHVRWQLYHALQANQADIHVLWKIYNFRLWYTRARIYIFPARQEIFLL